MSLLDILDTGMRIIFIVLAGLTLADYLRHRDRTRLDIHLMFMSVAVPMFVRFITQITGLPLTVWSQISVYAFIAQPHLLLRLTSYHRLTLRGTSVLHVVSGFSLVGLLLSWLILGLAPQPMPLVLVLGLVVYFVSVEGVATYLFFRGALQTSGVTQHRLRFVAFGSGCLALVLFVLGINVVTTNLWVRHVSSDLVPVAAVLCALSYYIGFLPPAFLRHAWKWSQFSDFRQEITTQTSGVFKADVLKTLCDSSLHVAGGSAVLALVPTNIEQVFRVAATSGSGSFPETLTIGQGVIAEAWIERHSTLRTNPKTFGPEETNLTAEIGSHALMAVPIESTGEIYGILVVLFHRVPLFPSDAERILSVFTQHVATLLAHDASIAEQKNLVKQLRQSNAELQRATLMKSEFLANMSHELRTPLNAIIGFSELMHDEKLGPISAQYKELLGDILTSGLHLLQLINDILDLAKVESGKMEFHAGTVELATLVGEVRDILRSLTSAKRLHVNTEVESGLGEVFLDPAKLKQVLYNYLSNAIKFTPAEGTVTIRVRAEDETSFCLEVQDTGIGIRAEDIDLLFKEFQQVDSSASKEYEGTGLGLALTKRIVEAQGGRVGVESTPKEGSVFFAVLPRRYDGPSKEGSLKTEVPNSITSQSAVRLLVIDDEIADLTWLENTLSDNGYVVQTAKSGQEALVKCRERVFDAIILDLLLPDMSGFQVLRQVREGTINENTPVIVVSVVMEKEAVAGFPVHSFLTKPIHPNELLDSLTKAGVTPSFKESVLVVDDDTSSRKLTEANLTQLGYHAVGASNGEMGLRMAVQHQVAAVVLDLMMPGMDGFEFLVSLRGTPRGSQIPVVVWTAKELTSKDNEVLGNLAQAVVLKRNGRVSDLLREVQTQVAAAKEDV